MVKKYFCGVILFESLQGWLAGTFPARNICVFLCDEVMLEKLLLFLFN